ncbi:MAG: metal-dependent transcriptional regulator [Flavobacteriaceae bacterium]|nr:metal-dependent transcriptional regulator [Flavobacteriaceae bacterium]MDG2314584.1 metal-dependent transcriptional regulator [Flavobacteriaceae bacterium]
MLTHSEENYLKTIFHLSLETDKEITTNSIASKINSKPSSVTEMLKKMGDKSLVSYQKYKGVSLTELGQKTALKIIRKHRLWEVFLFDKLNFSWDEVHEIAEQLEHVHSDKLTQELDRFLDYPQHDPHGDPIPNRAGFIQYSEKILLSTLEVGDIARFVGVKDSSAVFLQYLDKRNIALGDLLTISFIEAFDHSMHVSINDSNHILSKQTINNIYVLKV